MEVFLKGAKRKERKGGEEGGMARDEARKNIAENIKKMIMKEKREGAEYGVRAVLKP